MEQTLGRLEELVTRLLEERGELKHQLEQQRDQLSALNRDDSLREERLRQALNRVEELERERVRLNDALAAFPDPQTYQQARKRLEHLLERLEQEAVDPVDRVVEDDGPAETRGPLGV